MLRFSFAQTGVAIVLAVVAFVSAAMLRGEQIYSADASMTELEAVNDYGLDLVAYATVRRSDGTYRRMLVSADALQGLGRGQGLPEGTRILMETYYSPGERSTVFHMQKQGGEWRYGSFAKSVDLAVRERASCASCHARVADTDDTFTLPSLWAAAEGRGASDFACDESGRTPCDASVYRDGAAP